MEISLFKIFRWQSKGTAFQLDLVSKYFDLIFIFIIKLFLRFCSCEIHLEYVPSYDLSKQMTYLSKFPMGT